MGAILTPLLLGIMSVVGWSIKQRVESGQQRELQAIEHTRQLEGEMREDRLAVYMEILQPFVLVFSKDQGFLQDKAYRGKTKDQVIEEIMVSIDFRRAAFRMSLFASDEVLTAYNTLMQFFYSRDADTPSTTLETGQMMRLFGEFLLAIRRSVGNEGTKLDYMGMLEWLITDIRDYRELLETQGAI